MKFLIVITMCLSFANAIAQSQLEVVVTNIKNDNGNIRVGIFKDKETFLKKAAYGKIVKAKTGEVKIVFDDLPAGTYGISIIHDEDEDNELDSGMFGIPKEGFGFANDAMGTFGPPSFDKASVKIGPEKRSITIKVKYM